MDPLGTDCQESHDLLYRITTLHHHHEEALIPIGGCRDKVSSWKQKDDLSQTPNHRHLDPGLSSLQNCEKRNQMSDLYKTLSLRQFGIAKGMDKDKM